MFNFESNIFSGVSYLCQSSFGTTQETFSKILEKTRSLFYHCFDSSGLFLEVLVFLFSPCFGLVMCWVFFFFKPEFQMMTLLSPKVLVKK